MKSMAFVAYQNRLPTRSKPRRTENPSPRSGNQKFNLRTLFWFERQPNDIRHVAIDFKSSFWGIARGNGLLGIGINFELSRNKKKKKSKKIQWM